MHRRRCIIALVLALAPAAPATAEIKVVGDARMGLHDTFAATGPALTSKVTVRFEAAVMGDNGLSLAAKINNAADDGGEDGRSGTVTVGRGPWKLIMGDADSATARAIGQIAPVGLTELGNLNNVTFIANGGTPFTPTGNGPVLHPTADPSALVSWDAAPFALHASLTSPLGGSRAWALGSGWRSQNLRLGFAVEGQTGPGPDPLQVMASATVIRAPWTFRAIAAHLTSGSDHADQGAVSIAYGGAGYSVLAFATDDTQVGIGASARAVGAGLTIDLGQGAKFRTGWVRNLGTRRDSFDFGLALTF